MLNPGSSEAERCVLGCFMASQRANSDSARPPASGVVLDSPRIKILTLGDVGVGKSCFVKYYCEGRFVSKYIPTIGIDYGVKKIAVQPSLLLEHHRRRAPRARAEVNPSQPVRSHPEPLLTSVPHPPPFVHVNFWDVAGGGESFEVRNEFYEAVQGIVLMYDVRNASSFDALDLWWDEVSTYIPLPTRQDGALYRGGMHSSELTEDSANSNSSNNTNINTSGCDNRTSSDARRGSLPNAAVSSSPVRRPTLTTAHTAAGKMVGTNNGRKPIVILCAAKVDDVLAVGDGGDGVSSGRVADGVGRAVRRVVTEEQGRQWAVSHGCAGYYETSASSGLNVNTALDSLIYDTIATFM